MAFIKNTFGASKFGEKLKETNTYQKLGDSIPSYIYFLRPTELVGRASGSDTGISTSVSTAGVITADITPYLPAGMTAPTAAVITFQLAPGMDNSKNSSFASIGCGLYYPNTWESTVDYYRNILLYDVLLSHSYDADDRAMYWNKYSQGIVPVYKNGPVANMKFIYSIDWTNMINANDDWYYTIAIYLAGIIL